MKVGFIGIGNMASAIIKGMIQNGHTSHQDIYVHNTTKETLALFTSETGTQACSSNKELAGKVDVLVLAAKPNVFPTILAEIKDEIAAHQPLVVSIAAGTSLQKLSELLNDGNETAIIRVMPNLNSQIGEGMTAICGNDYTTSQQKEFIFNMFKAIGEVVELPEKDFSTFTAIAGSSPAFVFLFIDSLARAAVRNGMSKEVATKIAAQAVLGSGKLVLDSEETPWNLIDQVSSPGGTTVEGILALEDAGFISSITKAAQAVIDKDQEMLKHH
ncbi:pyrroline-5-carboxylate reductase [Carnobacterium inhibens]|uniref:Pyrroline-5-carboxylate reductase n=2 Tax=Carnobacterium inhibens TaxID=147709 RepID=U5SAM6_9LACT|nr:pyrroline-5-carboxylate reductase [Carnobacterium inhibens]AGY80902.1 pyrroline-5-carboxylate reductase [Carnobacterium inhibens subsp. gilichinskyi]MBC9826014.1 pyrroline-5-carboxylate reductase [Carnobacterium inhibens]